MVASASPGTGLGGRDMEARSIALPERPVDRPALRTLAVELARTALLTGVYVAAGKAACALAFVHQHRAGVAAERHRAGGGAAVGPPGRSRGAAGGVPVQRLHAGAAVGQRRHGALQWSV
jgi:hypothetical protein